MSRLAYLSRRSLFRLGFSVAGIAMLSAAACPVSSDNAVCGAPGTATMAFNGSFDALYTADLATSLSGGVRTYSWSHLVENVCPNEHVKAGWLFEARADKLPPGWDIEAGYLITALSGSKVPLTGQTANNIRSYNGATDIGLKQAYDGEPGRFLLYLDISFTSRGNAEEDRAVVDNLFKFMFVSADYKNYKGN